MPQVSLYLDHPGFFVHDANGDLEPADIPEIGAREPPLAWATDRVLAVGTIADVDGEVCITLDNGPNLRGASAFLGTLPTPSGAIAVTQSSGDEILRLEGLGSLTAIEVGVDDMRFPRHVHLLIRE